MPQPIPLLSDFNVNDCLDAQSAADHFLGKDLLEAEGLFKDHFLHYQEDLMWMGPIAFSYYVQAAVNYLLGPDAVGDSDAANSFPGAVTFQYESHSRRLRDRTGFLIDALNTIAGRLDRYGCDVEVYGDVADKYRQAVEQLQNVA